MVGGFPDSGDGRYSQKLEYKDWVKFNNAMRSHMNFVELLPMILTYLLIGGLFLPLIAMICGYVFIAGRIIFAVMYNVKGSNARKLGAILGSLPV